MVFYAKFLIFLIVRHPAQIKKDLNPFYWIVVFFYMV